MTLTPSERSWRRQAASQDRAYAAAYRAGLADGRRSMRYRRERMAGRVLLVALLVILWPLGVVVLAAWTIARQHRQHRTRWRTAALAGTWAACCVLVLVALNYWSPWPLLVIPAALLGWGGERVTRWHRLRRSMLYRRPAPRPTPEPGRFVEPYRVVFTDKAHHLETRTYGDGRRVTVDTLTGNAVPDPFGDIR